MIEIDGLKIERDEYNGQVRVTFPDGRWNGNIPEVANILLYEILKRIARPFPVPYPASEPMTIVKIAKTDKSVESRKSKRGRPKA